MDRCIWPRAKRRKVSGQLSHIIYVYIYIYLNDIYAIHDIYDIYIYIYTYHILYDKQPLLHAPPLPLFSDLRTQELTIFPEELKVFKALFWRGNTPVYTTGCSWHVATCQGAGKRREVGGLQQPRVNVPIGCKLMVKSPKSCAILE